MKGISARYIMAVLFSITYCIIMALLTIAVMKKVVGVDTYVAVLGAFALVVREIVSDYFQRVRPEDKIIPNQPIVEKKEVV
jgi:energy-converting hydrogenase Eha subunit A